MKKSIALIDVGSNSVRLLWGEEKGLGKKYVATTQLSEGLDATGRLGAEPMERTARAIASFCDKARAEGADEVRVFATEAVRAGANRAEFVALVKARTGLTVDVIDGDTEALCGYLGVAGVTSERVTVLDIGGASVELVVGEAGAVQWRKSLPLGVVRLKERYRGDYAALQRDLGGMLSGYGDIPSSSRMIAIGGTALSLASMLDGQTVYDVSRTHGYTLTADALTKLSDKLCAMAAEEIVASYPTVPLKRAETIAYGARVLLGAMERVGVRACVTSEADNLEGYLTYVSQNG